MIDATYFEAILGEKDCCEFLLHFGRDGRDWRGLLDNLSLSWHGNPQVNLVQ